MQIQITKNVYNKLSRNDKLRFIYIKTDPKFERLILKARKNLKIPPESWQNMEKNWLGNGPPESRNLLFTSDNKGDLVPYGDWPNKRKSDKKMRKKINKEVEKLIREYPILDEKWTSLVEMLICYNVGNFFPDKYAFAAQMDGSIDIKITHLTTPSDFIKWVKDNWKRFERMSRLSLPVHLKTAYDKKSDLPTYENLENIIKIIKDKKLKKKARVIAKEIDKAELIGQEEKINKAYHKIKKQLTKLEKETKKIKEQEISLFGR